LSDREAEAAIRSAMKRVSIVQARMLSTRLPGKVLRDLVGRPMLIQQLERLKTCKSIDELVVATTTDASDDAVADVGARAGVRVFRGSENDVLSRFVGAAKETNADVVVRITADCPLIDPGTTDRVVDELTDHASECDYASNVEPRSFPRGLDVEALFLDTLLRIDRIAGTTEEREHVTLTVRADRRSLFRIRSVEDSSDNSDLRWTVDQERDFTVVKRIYEELDLSHVVRPYHEILEYVRAHPELAQMNQDIGTWGPTRRVDSRLKPQVIE
jgi:spore coat polysaccharide biosynthesis protein SpsF